MQTWLRERESREKSSVLICHSRNGMSVKKEIPTLEHVTLVFELTSFAADVLGKLIKPRTNDKTGVYWSD